MTKNIDLTEETTVINFNESGSDKYFYLSNKYCWIKNTGSAAVNVSAKGADSVSVSPGECFRVTVPQDNKIALTGAGSVTLVTGNESVCPFM